MSYYTCPICGNPNMNHQSYSDGCFGIDEEYINCTTCNYYYEFCYGNYLESFGRYEFIWNYTLYHDHSRACRLEKKIQKAKFMSHRNWKKGLRKNYCKYQPDVQISFIDESMYAGTEDFTIPEIEF